MLGFFKEIVNNARKYFFGQRIVVLGARGVGKTTFLHFLQTGEIIRSHDVTEHEKYSSTTIKVGEKEIKIARGVDIGGGAEYYGAWREQIDDADTVIYLINIAKIVYENHAYIRTVENDINAIKNSIQNREEDIRIFLIGNHLDEVKKNVNEEKFKEQLRTGSQIIQEAIVKLGGDKVCQFHIGSLISQEEARALRNKIFAS